MCYFYSCIWSHCRVPIALKLKNHWDKCKILLFWSREIIYTVKLEVQKYASCFDKVYLVLRWLNWLAKYVAHTCLIPGLSSKTQIDSIKPNIYGFRRLIDWLRLQAFVWINECYQIIIASFQLAKASSKVPTYYLQGEYQYLCYEKIFSLKD